jgi:hypothetical protein
MKQANTLTGAGQPHHSKEQCGQRCPRMPCPPKQTRRAIVSHIAELSTRAPRIYRPAQSSLLAHRYTTIIKKTPNTMKSTSNSATSRCCATDTDVYCCRTSAHGTHILDRVGKATQGTKSAFTWRAFFSTSRAALSDAEEIFVVWSAAPLGSCPGP